jgi:hypothetical protein
MAVGLMYTARFSSVSVTNAVQDIWEIQNSATCGLILHWVKLTFEPTITSGVAQDVRARLQICERSTNGTGGSAVTPAGVHPRNSIASAVTAVNRTVVTTQGTIGDIHWDDAASIIVPYELIFTPDLRIPIQPSGKLCLFLTTALGAAYTASSTICWEEI